MAVGLLLLCIGWPVRIEAQEDPEATRCVSISLGPNHWASTALRRLQAVGAAGEYLSVQRGVTLCEAQAVLNEASWNAESVEARGLAVRLLDRLDREFPGSRVAVEGRYAPSGLHAGVVAGWQHREGVAAPGLAEFEPDRTGATPMEDYSQAKAELDLGVFTGRYVALRARPVLSGGRTRLETLEGVVGLGPIALTVGRGDVGFGAAESGGVVLGEGRLDRVEFGTPYGWRTGGLLRFLGGVGFTTFLARLGEARHPNDPFLWGATVSVQPHWRTTLSVHRGAMIRTDGEFPWTVANVLSLLVGDVKGGGFEDQIVSVEGRFHLPTERILPLTIYLEWGAEDAAGAWWDVPGRIIGVQVPMVPGLPAVSMGMERTSFGQQCCGNPMWYRHWSFPGTWALGDRPLGHPLGGNGTEWLAYTGIDAGTGGRLDLRGFHRDRGPDNLYTPGREGASWGGIGAFRWRIGATPEIFGSLSVERGGEWRQHQAELGGRITIGG